METWRLRAEGSIVMTLEGDRKYEREVEKPQRGEQAVEMKGFTRFQLHHDTYRHVSNFKYMAQ